MNITEQQLANAAKALGIDAESLEDKWSNGEKFAEWAVPVLEERHDLDLITETTRGSVGFPWKVRCISGRLEKNGPDIDTAVLLLAAKIGEGME